MTQGIHYNTLRKELVARSLAGGARALGRAHRRPFWSSRCHLGLTLLGVLVDGGETRVPDAVPSRTDLLGPAMIPHEARPRLEANLGYPIGPPVFSLEDFPADGPVRLPDRLDRPVLTHDIQVVGPRGQLEGVTEAVGGGGPPQGRHGRPEARYHFRVELETGVESG